MNWALVCGLILVVCVAVSIVLVSVFSQESPNGEMITWESLTREKAKNQEASAKQTLSKLDQLARIWSSVADADLYRVPAEYRQARKHEFTKLGFGDTTRGIVLTASETYMPQALTLLTELREIGCRLPVELWYRANELTSATIQTLRDRFRVLCHCIDSVAPLPVQHRFSVKVVSMYLTTFDEFLYLDADNHVLMDPAPLFDDPAFRRHGALFWPDRYPLEADAAVAYRDWPVERRAMLPAFQQNTAQIMVVLNDQHAALLWMVYRVLENNLESLFPAPYNYGDKDVFHSTWIAAQRSFSWVSHAVKEVLDADGRVVGLLQSDPQGQPVFLQELSAGPWVSLRDFQTGLMARIPEEIEDARKNVQRLLNK